MVLAYFNRKYLNSLLEIFVASLLAFIFLELQGRLLKLWPKVEFDFGPEEEKLEKKRRRGFRWLALLFSLFLIPLLVNFVSSYFFRN